MEQESTEGSHQSVVLGPEHRSLQIQELASLPTDQWTEGISSLYPDILTPQALKTDFQNLEEISKDVSRIRSRLSTGIKLMAAGCGLIIASLPVGYLNDQIYGWVMAAGGVLLFGGMSYSFLATPHQERAILKVTQWNNRGKSWLHQQRYRMFGS